MSSVTLGSVKESVSCWLGIATVAILLSFLLANVFFLRGRELFMHMFHLFGRENSTELDPESSKARLIQN